MNIETSSINYYLLLYKLDKIENYLIWFTDEEDKIEDGVISHNNKIISFKTKDLVVSYVTKKEIKICDLNKNNLILHELDIIKILNKKKLFHPNIYHYLLISWNLFNDICESLNKEIVNEKISQKYKNKKRAYKHISKIYDKVFWANNLDAVTPEGKSYAPIWKKSEIKVLKRIIRYGLEIFQKNLIEISSEEDLKKILSSNDK